MVFDALEVTDIVTADAKPPPNASVQEVQGYKTFCRQAFLIMIQAIDGSLLPKVSKLRSPYLIWKHLRGLYHRDSPFQCMRHLSSLFLITSTLDTSEQALPHEKSHEKTHSFNKTSEQALPPEKSHEKTHLFNKTSDQAIPHEQSHEQPHDVEMSVIRRRRMIENGTAYMSGKHGDDR